MYVIRKPVGLGVMIFFAFFNSFLWLTIYWKLDEPDYKFKLENNVGLI